MRTKENKQYTDDDMQKQPSRKDINEKQGKVAKHIFWTSYDEGEKVS